MNLIIKFLRFYQTKVGQNHEPSNDRPHATMAHFVVFRKLENVLKIYIFTTDI